MTTVTYKGHTLAYKAAEELMDAEIHHRLSGEVSFGRLDTEQSFFDAYVAAHAAKFGEAFLRGQLTDRKAKQRRLERAGYVHISGWVPNDMLLMYEQYVNFADEARAWIAHHREVVDRIANEPPKPSGRPKREA